MPEFIYFYSPFRLVKFFYWLVQVFAFFVIFLGGWFVGLFSSELLYDLNKNFVMTILIIWLLACLVGAIYFSIKLNKWFSVSRFYLELHGDKLIFKPSNKLFLRSTTRMEESLYSYVTGEDFSWSTTMCYYLHLRDDNNQVMNIFDKKSVAGDSGERGVEFRESKKCLRLKTSSDYGKIKNFLLKTE